MALSTELSSERVLSVLRKAGLLDEEGAKTAFVKQPAQRARLLRARIGGPLDRASGYRVSVAEVIASLELPRPDGEILSEDAIMQAIAQDLGLPWMRLDPLELDGEFVTSQLTRPFAERHAVLVIGQSGEALVVAMAEPTDVELQDNLRRLTGRPLQVVVASKADIRRITSEFYGFRSTIQRAEREYRNPGYENIDQLFRIRTDAELEATDKHIVAASDYVVKHAVEQGASDIHLEPKRNDGLVRYRIDGVLHTVHKLPRPVVPPLTSRLKMMARMDIAERRRPQDGRIKMEREGREIEMRVSTMPTIFGEKVVIRIFDPDVLLQDLGQLGFFPEQRAGWDQFLANPYGVVLVTGPTGSGKTTTLYSSLKALATEEVNVVTIEDPIEMVTEAFNQVQLNPRVDVTFASTLRTVLRQDPDIIMVGEIRDLDTARNAMQAALTGHLVFSTLHTNDAPTAFTRLVDLGIPPYLVASTVLGVAAQRLVRKVCPHCATDQFLTSDQMRLLGIQVPQDGRTLPVREGAGCVECRGTGYRGRSAVYEVLPVGQAMRQAVQREADAATLMQVARHNGMMTLHESALKKLAMGITTFAEVVRVSTSAEEISL